MKNYLRRLPILSFLLIAFLAACTAAQTTELETSQANEATITVYRAPT